MSWLLVGAAAFPASAVWLLALTQPIVPPVITAAIGRPCSRLRWPF